MRYLTTFSSTILVGNTFTQLIGGDENIFEVLLIPSSTNDLAISMSKNSNGGNYLGSTFDYVSSSSFMLAKSSTPILLKGIEAVYVAVSDTAIGNSLITVSALFTKWVEEEAKKSSRDMKNYMPISEAKDRDRINTNLPNGWY